MKKLIMLFLLVSFMCFGEEKTESKKSYEVVQMEEIDFLKTQLIKSNNKIDDLSKKIEELEDKGENNLGLTYNVDQIYQNSVQYYDKTIEFLKWLVGGMLLILGYLKWDGNKKYEKERKEITKELDKRVERMWEENKELKEKIAEQEQEVERKTLELDKKIEKTTKEMNGKLKEVEYNTELAIAINKSKNEDKLEGLKKLVEKYPKKIEIYLQLGYFFYKLEKFKEAIKVYDKVIELDGNNEIAYNNRALANSKLLELNAEEGNNEDAIKYYNKIIKLNPQDARAYLNRGNSNRNLERYTEAIEDYDMAIRLKPKDWMSYYNRGFAYNSLANFKIKENNDIDAKKYFEDAMKNYKEGIKLNSSSKYSIIAKEKLERIEEKLKKLEEKE